jgi:hypothetical protein
MATHQSTRHHLAYMPTPDDARPDRPLTPSERRLADDIFRTLRCIAANIDYTDGPGNSTGGSEVRLTFVFTDKVPAPSRVRIHYDVREPMSGYHEDGVGPDLGTAWTRLSDDDSTNGTDALPR